MAPRTALMEWSYHWSDETVATVWADAPRGLGAPTDPTVAEAHALATACDLDYLTALAILDAMLSADSDSQAA